MSDHDQATQTTTLPEPISETRGVSPELPAMVPAVPESPVAAAYREDQLLDSTPEGGLKNPYNPHHRYGCGCPSCNKKAKLARGEPLNTPKPKPPAAKPSPKRATPAKPAIDTVARARNAAVSRWEQEYDWDTTPYDDACRHLADLRKEIEKGARALQQRNTTANSAYVDCYICNSKIENGRWAQNRTVRNPDTGQLESVFLCSALCIQRYTYNPQQRGPDYGPTGLPKPEPSLAAQAEQKKPKEAKLHGRNGLLS